MDSNTVPAVPGGNGRDNLAGLAMSAQVCSLFIDCLLTDGLFRILKIAAITILLLSRGFAFQTWFFPYRSPFESFPSLRLQPDLIQRPPTSPQVQELGVDLLRLKLESVKNHNSIRSLCQFEVPSGTCRDLQCRDAHLRDFDIPGECLFRFISGAEMQFLRGLAYSSKDNVVHFSLVLLSLLVCLVTLIPTPTIPCADDTTAEFLTEFVSAYNVDDLKKALQKARKNADMSGITISLESRVEEALSMLSVR